MKLLCARARQGCTIHNTYVLIKNTIQYVLIRNTTISSDSSARLPHAYDRTARARPHAHAHDRIPDTDKCVYTDRRVSRCSQFAHASDMCSTHKDLVCSVMCFPWFLFLLQKSKCQVDVVDPYIFYSPNLSYCVY